MKLSYENCLLTKNPILAREWHPTLNGSIKPSDVTPSSNRKVWWLCDKKHEWQAGVNSRNQGVGCPFCNGKRASSTNNLLLCHPDLCKEWNYNKNKLLNPQEILPKSHAKVWWICEKGHEWESQVYSRSAGYGCPYCAGQKVTKETSLRTLNSDLASEWSITKNGQLTPDDVCANSNKKVWWMGKCGHEWESVISSRNCGGNGCPYCSGKFVDEDNNLEKLRPDLIIEWDYSKNTFFPKDVTVGSHRQAWWKCNKDHSWQAAIYSRNNGRGCPYCQGIKTSIENSLLSLYPELSSQWDHSKNADLHPEQMAKKSNKKVWWICNKNHSWKASISDRAEGTGCPYCSNTKVCADNCLSNSIYQHLCSEWNYEKNVGITPDNIISKSNKKIWWICSKGHEWKAVLNSRTQGHNCRKCSIETYNGENHYNWQGGLTNLNDYLRRSINFWVNKTLEKYNYKCAVTGKGGKLEVHHSISFYSIRILILKELGLKVHRNISSYTDEQLNLLKEKIQDYHQSLDGIPMRKDIHKLFHKIYGKTDTTIEHFYEFKNKYTNGDLGIV